MKSLPPLLVSFLALTGAAMADARPGETEIEFAPRNGEPVTAYQGQFQVPENRADPDSRMIEIGYVRFPAATDTPGAPIIYLAGGPGGTGTGTARGPRFPLFMAMRQHGDVYAYDQRGTGLSDNDLPPCTSSVPAPHEVVVSDADWAALNIEAARDCREIWTGLGIDVRGYTTLESARDLDALRQHIGADQISLWSISYGSHLAMAAIDLMYDRLDRVIMASAEGLDQTVKLPERTLAYFERLQAAINSQPAAAARYPDIVDMMLRVQARLHAEPMRLEIPNEDGTSWTFILQRSFLQAATGGLIADPGRIPLLLELYAGLDSGDATVATALIGQFVDQHEGLTFRLMPLIMDRASGISPERLARFEDTFSSSPVGAYLNAPMPQLLPFATDIDLGDDFRSGPHGDTPVLLLTGTLDGRTYPQGQVEALAGMSDVHQITIINAGHNLFMVSPEVGDAMHQFMRGEDGLPETITVDLPDFTASPFGR